MKFRKKPVVIEALELRWDNWNEMCEHVGVGYLAGGKPEGCYLDDNTGTILDEGQTSNTMGLLIPTLEGLMIGRQGDWIIKGIKGEIYPCKKEIFELTYEKVEDGQSIVLG